MITSPQSHIETLPGPTGLSDAGGDAAFANDSAKPIYRVSFMKAGH
jgi:hypothetical protein